MKKKLVLVHVMLWIKTEPPSQNKFQNNNKSTLIKSKCSCVCLSVRNTWGHNAEKVKMMESSLLREWVSILSECVYVKFHQIDFCTSRAIAKKQLFFGKYWQTNT